MNGRPRRLGHDGRYELTRPIGTGGFSTVYEAIDHRFEMPVAIKLLADNHALNIELRERFLAEAHIQRKLSATGVVPVHDIGESPSGQPYVVMALATSDLLRRANVLYEASGRIILDHLVEVINAMETAVGILHANNIIHRDIKPGNLLLFGKTSEHPTALVEPVESLLLSDLGVAKQLELDSGLTAAVGTPGFRPPEQGRVATVDRRADIYSSTALIYWLITGHPPVSSHDANEQDLLDHHVSSRLRQAIHRGLSPDPEMRHGTIGIWADELRAALKRPEMAVPPMTPDGNTLAMTGAVGFAQQPSPPAPAAAPARSLSWPALALAAVLGLGGGWAATTVLDRGPSVQESTADDGTRTTEVSDHGVAITIVGPSEVTVGETVVFSATVDGAASWSWVAPTGEVQDGNRDLSIVITGEGTGTVSVVATSPIGDVVTAPAEIRSTAS